MPIHFVAVLFCGLFWFVAVPVCGLSLCGRFEFFVHLDVWLLKFLPNRFVTIMTRNPHRYGPIYSETRKVDIAYYEICVKLF